MALTTLHWRIVSPRHLFVNTMGGKKEIKTMKTTTYGGISGLQ
jgi:hypothetical protein